MCFARNHPQYKYDNAGDGLSQVPNQQYIEKEEIIREDPKCWQIYVRICLYAIFYDNLGEKTVHGDMF